MNERPRPAGGLAALMNGLIDYAGLFPPAGLGMADAVARYARYRQSPGAWALGRFVVAASRLEELEHAALALDAAERGAEPWVLTALVSPVASSVGESERRAVGSESGGVSPGAERLGASAGRAESGAPGAVQLEPGAAGAEPRAVRPGSGVGKTSRFALDVARVASFNDAHAPGNARWRAAIRSIEMKAASPGEIQRAAESLPEGVEAYFEVPGDAGIEGMCHAAAASGGAVKVRTGGTTIDAFPPSAVVARVLAACAAAQVPFKATAGLHHAVRASHPVTYDDNAPRATMHGFLNVFVGACLLFAGKADVAMATQVLEDELRSSFRFSESGLMYREQSLSTAEIAAARRFARSFGSCSFEEPLAAL